jgi:hypothetical protein
MSLYYSFHRYRCVDKLELSTDVVQREFLEFISHEVTEIRFTMLRTMDKVVGGERGYSLVAYLAYGEQLTWGRK